MTKVLAISEAQAIAFHGITLIAISQELINANNIAKITNASKYHVSKVMLRLVKQGLIGSVRGPSGGFYLKKNPENIKLIEIIESIEGNINLSTCPIENEICPFVSFLMGGICFEIGKKYIDYLKNHNLQDILDNIPADFTLENFIIKKNK